MGRRTLDEGERERIQDAVRDALAPHEDVVLAYLHGSVAEDAEHVGDVDVAVLLSGRPGAEEALRRELRLEDEVAAHLDLPVDLRTLDHASASFRHGVLRSGRLLLERDPEALERLMAATLHQREDMRPYTERYRREALGSGA